mgnify:CR=1 FL=1
MINAKIKNHHNILNSISQSKKDDITAPNINQSIMSMIKKIEGNITWNKKNM